MEEATLDWAMHLDEALGQRMDEEDNEQIAQRHRGDKRRKVRKGKLVTA